jgi:FtsH-binding integral membrane protein
MGALSLYLHFINLFMLMLRLARCPLCAMSGG